MALTGPIDVHVIEQLAVDLDDRDLVRSVLCAYLEHLPMRRDALADAIAANDVTAVVSAAHALASASVTLGVRAIFAPARAIEDYARFGDLSEALELLQVIDQQAVDVMAVLHAW
jgi:HPt (histidine-containing phosphotransfer) domain-containing protein